MPAFGAKLSDEEIWAVLAYIKSLEITGTPVRTAGDERECKAQMRLKRRVVLLGAAALALGLLAALAMLRLDAEPKFESLDIASVDWGRHFELTDHAGRTRTPADFRGKVVAMFFGYTHCPDVCPITMAKLGEAMKLLGDDASHVQGLFITVDPVRDTPQVLAQYVSSFHPTFLGLYGDAQASERTAKEFKVYYQAHHANDHGAYSVDHSGQ